MTDSLLHILLTLQYTTLSLHEPVEPCPESSSPTYQMKSWEGPESGLPGAHPDPQIVRVPPLNDVLTCQTNWDHARQHPVLHLCLWLEVPPWMPQFPKPTAFCLTQCVGFLLCHNQPGDSRLVLAPSHHRGVYFVVSLALHHGSII